VDIRLKRAYDPAVSSDGYRVLIDRLWPRGVSRERAKLDEWERKLPPSTKLRQWFGHEPGRFEEFVGATSRSFGANARGSQSCGGGPATAPSLSSTPPGTPSTTTPSSSPRSCAADCRRLGRGREDTEGLGARPRSRESTTMSTAAPAHTMQVPCRRHAYEGSAPSP
jgi:hypothetical protein